MTLPAYHRPNNIRHPIRLGMTSIGRGIKATLTFPMTAGAFAIDVGSGLPRGAASQAIRTALHKFFWDTPPAVFIPLMGTFEFGCGMPVINHGADCLSNILDKSNPVSPVQWLPSENLLAGAAVCEGLALFLFGVNGLPERLRSGVKLTVDKAPDPVKRTLSWIGARTSGRLPQAFVREGFVGGIVRPLAERHENNIIFRHPYIGTYTRADPKIWGMEIGMNLVFYGAMSLALGFPFWTMLLPATALSAIATISTARMTKVWSAEGKTTHIKLGRSIVFPTVNVFSSLSASGLVGFGFGFGIQVSVGLAIALATFGIVRPTTTTARSSHV